MIIIKEVVLENECILKAVFVVHLSTIIVHI